MMDRVLVVNVPKYGEGAYIIYSAAKRDMKETYGEVQVKSIFSFCFINDDYAAEWEPEYGPIQIWHKCEKEDQDSRLHYIFDYTDSGNMNWSQMAVNEYNLPESANQGDWQYIFNVLKDWTHK